MVFCWKKKFNGKKPKFYWERRLLTDCQRGVGCGNVKNEILRKKETFKIGRDVTIFLKDPAWAWVFFFVCTLSFWWYARQFIDKSVRYQQRGVKTTE